MGFSLGYAKAMHDQGVIQETALAFKLFLQDVMLADDIKRKKAADAAAGLTVEPVYDAEEVVDETDDYIVQGETPH